MWWFNAWGVLKGFPQNWHLWGTISLDMELVNPLKFTRVFFFLYPGKHFFFLIQGSCGDCSIESRSQISKYNRCKPVLHALLTLFFFFSGPEFQNITVASQC